MADKTQEGSFTSTLPGGSPLYFKVKTAYKTDAAGNPIRGSGTHTLLYNPGNGTYYPAATTTDFKTFELKKYTPAEIANAGIAQYAQPDGTVLGPTAARSLQTKGGQLNQQMRNATALSSINNGLSMGQAQAVNNAPQTSPNAPAPDSQAAAPPPQSLTQAQALSDKDIAYAGNVRLSYTQEKPIFIYPITRDPKQDYIKFSMFKYEPRKVAAGQGGDEFGGRGENRVPIGNVALPIQPTISDSNLVQWGEDPLNALSETGAQISLQLMQGNAAGAQEQLNQTTQENLPAIKDQVVSNLAAAAVGTNANLFTRLTGAIVNPNLELLFKGPSLRSFSFTFSMSAREETEAAEIRRIIRFFKQGMSVKRAEASLYLKSPHTFGISYIYNGQGDHPWINRIKECALTNCAVNYTPAGNYATYEGGAMTQYDLSLTFSELEPIYDDDYGNLDGNADTQIGY